MIGIIGYGFVGKATSAFGFLEPVQIYDKYVEPHTENWPAVINQEVVFVCVPTNPSSTGQLDIAIVEDVVGLWSQRDNSDSILVIKSTVPVGTTVALQEEYGTDQILFNPEFLTERTANLDFLHADEVIIGTTNQKAGEKLAGLYLRLLGPVSMKITDPTTAELVKLTRNSLYATKIEFMNEIYDLCLRLGVDYDTFRTNFAFEGKNAWVCDQHTYVPGPDGQRGFGGKCLPKDSEGLLATFKEVGISASVLASTVVANRTRR
jgi:UDPglucose 6-dehydrogenase